MPKDTVKDLYQRWSDTFAERGELPLVEWRELIEEWGQATAEPGSVDYIEIDAGGVPAMWLRPPDDAIRRLADWARAKVGL